jgi:hypothetical protein
MATSERPFASNRGIPLKSISPLLLACVVAAAGCAQTPDSDEGVYALRMNAAGDAYTACVSGEAEKDAMNPAGVEDIAVAAHGRCWSRWDAYRDATSKAYSAGAKTRDEKQFAHDRTDAHLRQFERETRRYVMDRMVERTLTKKEQR